MVVVSLLLAGVAVLAFGPTPALTAAVAIAAVTPSLIRTDVLEHRLPNRLVATAGAAGIAGVTLSWLATASVPLVPLLAGVLCGALLLVLALLGGMGMGDAKLAAALGLASPTATVALLWPTLAFLLGGMASVAVMIRRGRHAHIPFGPFLLAGYFGALLVLTIGRWMPGSS
jgi:leader peptidase (prepilin peptidase)/N-methyltransferase